MDITVKYSDRTYGTGESAESYTLTLSQCEAYRRPDGAAFPHKKDSVYLKFEFKTPVEGYSDSLYKRSEAWVTAATAAMSFEEAEELGRLLLYSVEHAKITKSPVNLTLTRGLRKRPTRRQSQRLHPSRPVLAGVLLASRTPLPAVTHR
jgi:hypothetical protein